MTLGKRPGAWKPFWRKIIYFISSPAQEFERTQIDLDASEAPGPFRGSWESCPRLLISPTSNEGLRPAVLRTARKPPALIRFLLQLAACALKSGWVSKRAFSALSSQQRPSAVLLGTKMKAQRPELKRWHTAANRPRGRTRTPMEPMRSGLGQFRAYLLLHGQSAAQWSAGSHPRRRCRGANRPLRRNSSWSPVRMRRPRGERVPSTRHPQPHRSSICCSRVSN